MASYAESGVDWAAIWRDNRGNVGAVAFVAAFMTALVLRWEVTPFHYYDMLVVTAVATGPALIVLAVFSGLGDHVLLCFENESSMGATNAVAGLFLIAIASPGNVLLWANERFDPSPSRDEVVPVVEKWTRTGKHTTTYLAGVTTNVPSPLGEHSFYGSQPVAMSRIQWESIVPGTSRLVLHEHAGALRAIWYERTVDVLR